MGVRRAPSLRLKIGVSVVVTVLAFCLLEGMARVLGVGLEFGSSFGRFEEQVHVLLRQGLFVRDGELFWRLRPVQDLKTPIAPGGLRVGRLGLRGPEWPRSAGAGFVRIAALGDSCTFGWRVRENEAYPAALGTLLRAQGLQAEVINAGVPGYTSFQGLQLLKRDLLALGPRAVVFCFGWNELWPARGQQDVTQSVGGWPVRLENLLGRSHFFRLLRRGYVAVRSDVGAERTAQTLPRVSPGQFRKLLDQLAALCRERGLALVLVLQPAHNAPHAGCWNPAQHEQLRAMHAVVREVAAAHEGIVLVDAAGLLAGQPQDSTFVDCVHPSAAGHALMAGALAEAVEPWLRQAAAARP